MDRGACWARAGGWEPQLQEPQASLGCAAGGARTEKGLV